MLDLREFCGNKVFVSVKTSIFLYFILTTFFAHNVYQASIEICRSQTLLKQSTGWIEGFLGFRRDTSDINFEQFIRFQGLYNIPGCLLLFPVFQRKRGLRTKIASSCFFIIFLFGVNGFLVYVTSILFLHAVAQIGGKRLVWTCSLFYSTLLGTTSFQYMLSALALNHTQLVTALAWIPLKFISHYHDHQIGNHNRSFKSTLLYYLFPFNLVYGPFICFNHKVSLAATFLDTVHKLMKWVCIIAILWFGLHFLHFNTLIMRNFFNREVTGLLRMTCFFFSAGYYCSKVKCMHAISTSFMDSSITKRYTPPICVLHVYDYRILWRKFDSSLHIFFHRYIIGAKKTQPINNRQRTISTIACYIYVIIFHGYTTNVLVWGLVNFLVYSLSNVIMKPVAAESWSYLFLMVPFATTSMIISVLFITSTPSPLPFLLSCALDPFVWLLIALLLVSKKLATGTV